MKISELLEGTKRLDEVDNRPTDNFSAEDLHHLSKIKDLSKAKEYAFELISRPSKRPMTPAKVAWFKSALAGKKSVQDVTKMLWDMLLSGEGHSVIGSKTSTSPNVYRQRFGEAEGMTHRAYDLNPVSAMTPDKKVVRMASGHDVLDLPVGSVVLHADVHDDRDARKASYSMVKKIADTDDLMDQAFEDIGPLEVSSYARSADVELAFAKAATMHLH